MKRQPPSGMAVSPTVSVYLTRYYRRISPSRAQAKLIATALLQTILADFIEGQLKKLLTACADVDHLCAVAYTTTRPYLCLKRPIYFKIILRCEPGHPAEITNIFIVGRKQLAGLNIRHFEIDSSTPAIPAEAPLINI